MIMRTASKLLKGSLRTNLRYFGTAIQAPGNEKVVLESFNTVEVDIDGRIVKISPLARELAYQQGLTLASIIDIGSGGAKKILLADVESFGQQKTFSFAKEATKEGISLTNDNLDQKREDFFKNLKVSQPDSVSSQDTQPKQRRRRMKRSPGEPNKFSDSPVSQTTQQESQQMESVNLTVPSYSVTMAVRMDNLIELRRQLNDELLADSGVQVSIQDFLIKAAALTSKTIPESTHQWQGDFVRAFSSLNVSFTVNTGGSMTSPVIKNVDKLRLSKVSEQNQRLTQRALENSLTTEETTGATLSMSIFDEEDIIQSNEIINSPQSIYVTVGAPQATLVYHDEHPEGVQVQEALITITSDHRTVDGAISAQWLNTFKTMIENPLKILVQSSQEQ